MYTAFLSTVVFTSYTHTPRAEALLIRDNTIIAIGNNFEIESQCPEGTKKIYLHGCFITPGFVDAHTHVWSLGHTLTMVNLRGITSLDACKETIAKVAKKAMPGEWILGRNWNQNIWDEKRDPTRHDLDEASPNNPAVMIRICGHANWCNTEAFELAGVTAETKDPFGGKIDREKKSNYPAGVIRECREIVEYVIPVPDIEIRKKAFLNCQEIFLSYGITGVHSFETLSDYQVVHEVQKEGKLKLRVYHTVHEDEQNAFDIWDKVHHSQTDMLWHGHIKMFADGSLGAKSAYLHSPYKGSDNNCGISCMTEKHMIKNIKQAYSTGRGVIFHAIGDRALTQCLDAIEIARKAYPGNHRDRIEHLQLTRIEDLSRMKQMDIAASVQPMSILSDFQIAENIWGKKRCKNAYCWKTMVDIGLRLIFSSDAPIEPINPMEGLQAAVTRKGFETAPETPWQPEQCISLDTALKAYFKNNGWATRKDELFGNISPGKRADLTILEKNPFCVPKNEIRKIRVKMTVVNGQIVYKNQ